MLGSLVTCINDLVWGFDLDYLLDKMLFGTECCLGALKTALFIIIFKHKSQIYLHISRAFTVLSKEEYFADINFLSSHKPIYTLKWSKILKFWLFFISPAEFRMCAMGRQLLSV